MPKGTMTLDKLAWMVQQGFATMEKSFIQQIDELATELRGRLDRLEVRMTSLENRIDGLEAEVAAIHRQLIHAVYENEFTTHERRVEKLERRAGLRVK